MDKMKLDDFDQYVKYGITTNKDKVSAGLPAPPETFEESLSWADRIRELFRVKSQEAMHWSTVITMMRNNTFFAPCVKEKLIKIETFLETTSIQGDNARTLLGSALDVLDEKRGLHGWRLWLAIGGALSAGVAFDGCVEAASDKTVAEWAYETATEDAPSE